MAAYLEVPPTVSDQRLEIAGMFCKNMKRRANRIAPLEINLLALYFLITA